MISSARAQDEVNESHIHEVPKNNELIFHVGEVQFQNCAVKQW